MARTLKNLFGLIKEKAVPQIEPITEKTRDGLPKAYIPKFIYKPPFGYPRFVDLPNIRRLAATPYVDMCITTIIDELSSISWDIVVKEGIDPTPAHEEQIKHVKSFYENPNTNKESFDELRRKYLRDLLEVDAGVINKIFNLKEEMVEMVARDGATFTKNPDIYGMFTDREDIIMDSNIATNSKEARLMEPGWITAADAREKAAYFQYGWITGARPVPFGKKEIVWMERHPRTDSIYGRSPVEILATTIQTLVYSTEQNLEYFNDNSIPKGVLGLDGLDTEGLKAFREQWKEQQRKKDTAGNWKKDFYNIPIVGNVPTFTRLQFSNAELELLEGQKWWSKMVWACFGVTATELGYTEDAKGLANQIVQSNIFRKRAINPILRLEEYKHNHEILSEFEYPDLEFKFQMFDVEEETKKANLYKVQIDSGIRTVNEIRVEEGLEEVEWGDDDPKRNQGNNFNFNPFAQEEGRKEEESEEDSRTEGKEKKAFNCECIKCKHKLTTEKHCKDIKCPKCGGTMRRIERPGVGQKDIEKKPGMGRSKKWWDIYHALIRQGHSKESAAKIASSRVKKKALNTEDNPLILRENETMDSNKLKRSIIYLMNQNEEKIKRLIEIEIGKNKLQEIKDLPDLAKAIKRILTFEGLKIVSDAVIKNTFVSGWDDAEKQLDKNLMINNEAITFIQDYTFNNIKGMTDEIMQDLRQELERGIMAGEGIVKIKDRVSKVFDVGENRAEIISITETNRAENQGKLQAFKASGERYQKKWSAAMSDRTCAICKRLDGQIVNMDENFKDKTTGWEGPCPPAHPRGRCSVLFILKE